MSASYHSIGQAAQILGVSTETLRHYDRIGLLSPSHRDPVTHYRYYSEADLTILRTIRALQSMDISLEEIGDLLAQDQLDEVVAALLRAEKQADTKIQHLLEARQVIERARTHYQSKLMAASASAQGIHDRVLAPRTILLSTTLRAPAVDILWDYHRHYREQLDPGLVDAFSFEDVAGLYLQDDRVSMFVLCSQWMACPELRVLPGGTYLCCSSSADALEDNTAQVEEAVQQRTGTAPSFLVCEIILSGILKWTYDIQGLVDVK